jgi:hypothetical protein
MSQETQVKLQEQNSKEAHESTGEWQVCLVAELHWRDPGHVDHRMTRVFFDLIQWKMHKIDDFLGY